MHHGCQQHRFSSLRSHIASQTIWFTNIKKGKYAFASTEGQADSRTNRQVDRQTNRNIEMKVKNRQTLRKEVRKTGGYTNKDKDIKANGKGKY